MKISLSIITKDEEVNLAGMLESVKDVVDEIIIVDTGSTDGTVELARAYTDKVFIHPKADVWREKSEKFNFAEARNYALDQCSGDWILSLDCDERMEPETASKLREVVEKMPDSVHLVMMTIVMCRDDGTPYQEFLAERLWRHGFGYRWENGMHNVINVPVDDRRVSVPEFRIIHNRGVKSEETRTARGKQRLAMAEEIFIAKIESDPKDSRSMFYLAGTYYDCQMFDKAVEWFEKYLEVSDWPEERYQAGLLLAQAYVRLDSDEKAKAVLSSILAENWRRAEAYLMLGQLAYRQGDFKQAEWWHKCASLKPKPVDPLFVEPDAHSWEPHVNLWLTYRQLGDNQKAAEHGRIALSMNTPNADEIIKFEKNHTQYKADTIGILVDRGQMDFIAPVIRHFEALGKVVHVSSDINDIDQLSGACDLLWCEWAGDLAIHLTKLDKKCRIIVRVHGYETHSGHIEQVDWHKVDDVIFVAEYLRDLAIAQAPSILSCNTYVVPGGIETDKFSIAEDKTGKKIALACYGNQKKNFPLALQIFAKCPSDYELHIATEWQDHRLQIYVEHITHELGLNGRVFFHPWQSDLNEFYKDKDFYLSSSEEESFHYALAEAMAAGLKPVIHAWKSARDFYEDKWIFTTVDEAVAMLTEGTSPHEYRQYAKAHLDISKNLGRIDRIIRRPNISVSGRPRYEHSAENKVINTLQELGCRTDDPKPEVNILLGNHPVVEPWMKDCKKVLWLEDVNLAASDYLQELVDQVDLVVCQNAHWMERVGDKARFLPIIGAVYPFQKNPNVVKQYDVGFVGCSTERRDPILDKLGEICDIAVMTDVYDHEQVNLFYNSCKIVVNLHAYDDPITEWRIAEAMAAGACVVSEPLPEGHPFPSECFWQTNDVAGSVNMLLSNDELREATAKRGHSWIWRHGTLARSLERLLDEVGL
jgi:glycosyltransferase involved in cell wall biosynthesis